MNNIYIEALLYLSPTTYRSYVAIFVYFYRCHFEDGKDKKIALRVSFILTVKLDWQY